MNPRKSFLRSLSRTSLVFTLEGLLIATLPRGMLAALDPDPSSTPIAQGSPLGFNLVDVAAQAGLNSVCVFGDEYTKKWIVETTGCGIAFFDYDQDGWLDIFQVCGTKLEGFPKGKEPTCRLYRNIRDKTYTDVAAKSGLTRSAWDRG